MGKRCENLPSKESGATGCEAERACNREQDRGFHFKPDEVEEELKKGGAKNIEDVWIFPANAGKLCDPLDTIFGIRMKSC